MRLVLTVIALAMAPVAQAHAHAPDPLFDDDAEDAESFPDPFESSNRAILGANLRIDRWFIDPLTRGYSFIVPSPVRRSIRLFFRNLNSPSIVVNDVLQREFTDAGVTALRTGINTTAGIAGLFDPATRLGLDHHDSDFGQTLALAGVHSGPYMVLPVLGPTNVRDGTGALVDFAFRPTTYLFGTLFFPGLPALNDQLIYSTIQGSGSGLVEREVVAEELRALRESSVDFYATLRSAFSQARTGAIWHRRERHHEILERALLTQQCRPRGRRSSPSGRWRAPRSRRVSSPHCSRLAAAPARSRSL